MYAAITSNRRRIDPHLLLAFDYPVQEYKESDGWKLLCLIYFAKRNWPLHVVNIDLHFGSIIS